MNLTTPSPEDPQQLLFAPSELLACGLRAAHPFPLVGKRTTDGIESWRMPAGERAWSWPLIEWTRAGSSYAAIGFDCDSREAVERVAASCMGAGGSSDSERLRHARGERTRASLLSSGSAGSPWRACAG